MPEGTRPTRLAIAQEFLMSVGNDNVGPSMALLSPHATYRVTGNHALAGVFSGTEDIARHLAALHQRTGGTFETVKWEDWMVGEQHVAALSDVHIRSGGQKYMARHLTLVRFDADDKILEITVLFEDESSMARFIGA